MTTIVSAIYDSYADAAAAVERLKTAGVPASDISMVSNDSRIDRSRYRDYRGSDTTDAAATGTTMGAAVGGAGGLLAGLGLVAIPGLGPVVAAGWLAATLAGAAAMGAAGGIVGALVGAGVEESHAHAYAEGVRRGGTLVNVRATDVDRARIQNILDTGAYRLSERESAWRNDGWNGQYPT